LKQGANAAGSAPEGLAAFHKAEVEKGWPIIRAANIKGGMVAVAATTANAAARLEPLGAELRELPLTLARIWALIKGEQAEPRDASPADVDPQVATVGPTQLLQRPLERHDGGLASRMVGSRVHQHADAPHQGGGSAASKCGPSCGRKNDDAPFRRRASLM
jgi:hypothetical protein